MNTLGKIKSHFQRSQALSTVLLNCIEIQLLTMFFIKMQISPYQYIWQVTIISSFISDSQNFFIYFLFAKNLVIIGLIVLFNIVKPTFVFYSQKIHLSLVVYLKIFTFIFLVPLFLWSLNQFMNSKNLTIVIMSFFNMIIYSALAIIYQVSNQTNRIIQKDFCSLRNPSIITPLLLILTLISFQVNNPMFLFITLAGRSIFKIIQTIRFYETELIQKNQLFYGPFFIYISAIGIITQLTNSTILKQNAQCFFIVAFGIFLCYQGIQKNYYCLLNMKISKSSLLKIINQVDQESLFAENRYKVVQNFQNQSRTLLSIYLERLKVKQKQKNNYDLIWKYFIRKMVNHKINCSNTICECRAPARSGKQFQNYNIMFLKTIFSDFQNNLILPGQTNLKILKIYMTLQIQNAPLKAHHELIQLKGTKISTFQQLQVNHLLNETKECFDKIFTQRKVQNQTINVSVLVQAEKSLNQIKIQVQEVLQMLLNYYQKILQSSCQMNEMSSRSKQLTLKKKKIQQKISFHIQNYQSQSQQLNSYIFLFQKYLDPYHDQQFEKILEKAELKRKLLKKGEVDVFQPQYGTIQIDLVRARGKIVNITNNLCKGFNHDKADMINKNINHFMPRIFGRYHDKFLRNFIQRGSFKILKSKEKVFFARNSKKFIFPINVRLKIQYQLKDNFYATTLIRPLKSKSNFIIADQNGKIQQLTEQLYQTVFKKLFKQQIGRVKNFSIFKMLLSLNHHIKNNQYGDQERIFQGVILGSQSIETMEAFGMRKDLNLSGTMTETKDIGSSSVQNSTSVTNLDSQVSMADSKQNKFGHKQKMKYLQDVFIPFINQINIQKLKGFKVKYKYSIIETSQFDCDLIEIVSIERETCSDYFKRQTVRELLQIAKIYQIQDKVADKLYKIREKYEQLSKNQGKDQEISLRENQNFQGNSQDQFDIKKSPSKVQEQLKKDMNKQNPWERLHQQMNIANQPHQDKRQILNTQNSESSSLLVNQDNSSSKKQMFKAAFNDQQNSNAGYWLVGLNVFFVITFLVMFTICAVGLGLIFYQQKLFKNNIFVLNLNEIVQYRSGYQQLQTFYKNMNLTVPSYLAAEKAQLCNQMSIMLEEINNLIIESMSGYIYQETTIEVIDQNTLKPYTMNYISLFNKFLEIFQTQGSSFQFFRLNYQNIHLTQLQLIINLILFVESLGDDYVSAAYNVYYAYWLILFITGVLIIIWERRSKNQEDQILSMLCYNGVKEIKNTIEILKQIKKIMKNQKQLQKQNGRDIKTQKKNSGLSVSMLIPSLKVQTNKPLKIHKDPVELINIKVVVIVYVILGFLTNISIAAMYLFQLTDSQLMAADAVVQGANLIQCKPFLFINVGLEQVNRFLEGKQPQVYSPDILMQFREGFFDFRDLMSNGQYYGSKIVDYASKTFSTPICQVVDCSNGFNKYNNISFEFLVNEMRNKFQLIIPVLQNQQNLTQQFLNNWILQNQMLQILQSFSQFNKYKTTFDTQLKNLYKQENFYFILGMIGFALAFVPINTLILFFMRKKLKYYLQNLILNAEHMFRHFSVQSLSENMYIVSYFNEKLKKRNTQKS